MQNITMNYDAKTSKLTMVVDCSKTGSPSKSGKTTILASTAGNVLIGEAGVKVGLNVYKPREITE